MPDHTIFVTGTGHTGSGCILDWLREQPACHVLPVRPFEFRHFGHDGVRKRKIDLALRVSAIVAAAATGEKRRIAEAAAHDLEAFLAGHKERIHQAPKQRNLLTRLLRRGPREKRRLQPTMRNPETKSQRQGDEDANFDLSRLHAFLAQLGQPGFDEIAFWKQWFHDKIERATPHGRLAAIDKSFPLSDIDDARRFMEITSPAKVIIVLRDAVDQICANYQGKRYEGSDKDLRKLDERLDEKLAETRIAIGLGEDYPDRIRFVHFEDFVHRHAEVAAGLAEWIGFSPVLGDYARLDLQVSAGTIGLAEGYPDIAARVREHPYHDFVRNMA